MSPTTYGDVYKHFNVNQNAHVLVTCTVVSIRVQNPNGRLKVDIEGGDAGDCGDYVGPWAIWGDVYTGFGYDSIFHESIQLSVSNFLSVGIQPSVALGTLSISANGMPNLIPTYGLIHEAPVYFPANFKFEFTWRPDLVDFATAPNCTGAFGYSTCCTDDEPCALYGANCDSDSQCGDGLICPIENSCADLGLPWGFQDATSNCCVKQACWLPTDSDFAIEDVDFNGTFEVEFTWDLAGPAAALPESYSEIISGFDHTDNNTAFEPRLFWLGTFAQDPAWFYFAAGSFGDDRECFVDMSNQELESVDITIRVEDNWLYFLLDGVSACAAQPWSIDWSAVTKIAVGNAPDRSNAQIPICDLRVRFNGPHNSTCWSEGNLPNGDVLPDSDFLESPSWEDCQQQCYEHDSCTTWTWRTINHPDNPFTCQLRDVISDTITENNRHISCPVVPCIECNGFTAERAYEGPHYCSTDSQCGLFGGVCSVDDQCSGELVCSDEPCDSLGIGRFDGSYRCCVQPEIVREVFRFTDNETDTTLAGSLISASTIYDDDPRILRITVGDQTCVTEPLEADPSTGVGVFMTVSITIQNYGSSVAIDIDGAPAGTCDAVTSLGVSTVAHPTAKLVTLGRSEETARGQFTARFISECQIDGQCPIGMLCSRENCHEMLPKSFGCCYDDPCATNPCLNDGTCIPAGTPEQYACDCSSVFEGPHCEISPQKLMSLQVSALDLSPSFNSSHFEYSVNVPDSVEAVIVNFEFVESATVRILGREKDSDESDEQVLTYELQVDGGAQVSIPMNANSYYEATIEVTARDGVTQSEYVIGFTRDNAVGISDGLPELDSAMDRWQLVIYLFAACLVGWAATTYFLRSTYDDFKINDSKPFTVFSSVFDVGSDALFTLVLSDQELTTLLYIVACLLGSTILVNAIAMIYAVRFETKTNPKFKEWQRGSPVPASAVALLSLANCESLTMMSAGSNKTAKAVTQGKKHKSVEWFSAPVSEDFERKLRLPAYWSILADDLGLTVIQTYIIVKDFEGAAGDTTVFLVFKVLMLVARVCLVACRLLGGGTSDRGTTKPNDDVSVAVARHTPGEIELAPPSPEAIRQRLEDIREMQRKAVDEENVEKCVELEGLMAEHVGIVRKLMDSYADFDYASELERILEEFDNQKTPRNQPEAREPPSQGQSHDFSKLPHQQKHYEDRQWEYKNNVTSQAHDQIDEMFEYLGQLGVQKHLSLLRQNGYRSLDDLKHASADDLESIGLLRDHALVIARAATDIQTMPPLESSGRLPTDNRRDSHSREPSRVPAPTPHDGYLRSREPSRGPRGTADGYIRSQEPSAAHHAADDDYSRVAELSQRRANIGYSTGRSREPSRPQRGASRNGEKDYFPFERRPSVSQVRNASNEFAQQRRSSVSRPRNATDDYTQSRNASLDRIRSPRRASVSRSRDAPSSPRRSSVSRSRDTTDAYAQSRNTSLDHVRGSRRASFSRSRDATDAYARAGNASEEYDAPRRASISRSRDATDASAQSRNASLDHHIAGPRRSSVSHDATYDRNASPRRPSISRTHSAADENVRSQYATRDLTSGPRRSSLSRSHSAADDYVQSQYATRDLTSGPRRSSLSRSRNSASDCAQYATRDHTSGPRRSSVSRLRNSADDYAQSRNVIDNYTHGRRPSRDYSRSRHY